MCRRLFFFVNIFANSLIVSAQSLYSHDRVYTANQVSNTVSVVDPSTNRFLGEIKLGKSYPDVLSPLYKGQVLIHGLRYSREKKMLAAVAIGSNSVTLISTETNQVIKTIYVGRSPHEPTFTPDSKQIWVSVRGEAYISVIDVSSLTEIKRVPVADGPGMVSFSPDGKLAYVCSSFTPELDIVDSSYQVIAKIPVVSPFSPNIFTSPRGEWVALTHKDVGKVTVINTALQKVEKVINTGAITNHVTFTYLNDKLLMLVTVGGENTVKVFDVSAGFQLINTISVGQLPHGIWASADGKWIYIGLEYADQVQAIDLQTMNVLAPVKIGQSPQALVYADGAVSDLDNNAGLTPLNDSGNTQNLILRSVNKKDSALGRLAVRPIGLSDLIEQIFTSLKPNTPYTLALSKSSSIPYQADYEINSFRTDAKGKYMGQSTGLIKSVVNNSDEQGYKRVILIDKFTGDIKLIDSSSDSSSSGNMK